MALYRVNFVAHKGTLLIANTLHVVAHGSPAWTTNPDPTAQAMADEVNTHLQALYRSLLTTTWTFDRIDVYTVTDPSNPAQVPTAGSHTVGVLGTRAPADEDLPPRIGGLVVWRTASVGRSFRGRFFAPPLEGKTAVVADLISATNDYSTGLTAFADKVKDANLAAGGTWSTLWQSTWSGRFVVYSPTRHAQGLSPFTSDITGYSYSRRLAYLSSRDS